MRHSVLEYPVWPYYLVHVTSCYKRQKKHKNFSRPDPSVTQQWSLQQAIGRLKVVTVGWCCPTECPCNLKILKDSVTASCKRKKHSYSSLPFKVACFEAIAAIFGTASSKWKCWNHHLNIYAKAWVTAILPYNRNSSKISIRATHLQAAYRNTKLACSKYVALNTYEERRWTLS